MENTRNDHSGLDIIISREAMLFYFRFLADRQSQILVGGKLVCIAASPIETFNELLVALGAEPLDTNDIYDHIRWSRDDELGKTKAKNYVSDANRPEKGPISL